MAKSQSTSKIILKFTGSLLQLFVNIIIYTIVILAIVKASSAAYSFTYRIFGSVRMDTIGMNVTIQVNEGESEMNIAGKLELSKLIPDKYSFYLKAKLIKAEILPGTYLLNTAMDYDEILAVLTNPNASMDDSPIDARRITPNDDYRLQCI